MTYITVMQSPRYKQITLDELLDGISDLSKYIDHMVSNTRTYSTENINEKRLATIDVDNLIRSLKAFNQRHNALFEVKRGTLYRSFHIPKSSGGLRKIDAPKEALMEALRQLKYVLEVDFHALYHTSAYAYVRGRSILDAVKKHQQNESWWFGKFDFTNFFGSTTLEFALAQLSVIFPFSEVMKVEEGREELRRALSLCFLDGGLPQGTPTSPLLTNLLMIPIDHEVSNTMRNYDRQSFVFTRYADDMLVSSRHEFDAAKVQEYIEGVVKKFNAPYKFNNGKTRYGSRAGRNWNLGLMLNKENEITIGHQKKKQFKAMIHNFVKNLADGVEWDKSDLQSLNGLISYYMMVEKSYITHILDTNSKKAGYDVLAAIRERIK